MRLGLGSLFVGVGLWRQYVFAKDQGPWAEQVIDTTFVSVVRTTTKIIKAEPDHVTTRPDFTIGDGDGVPLQHGFTTVPLFSTETYEVEECQFDNDDPGFSKCHTATTVVTYVRSISTSWYDDVTDTWNSPPPWQPTTITWEPTSVIPLPTILPTTPTAGYPHPPSSYGAPPWETSLDLCDVFSATWCQTTSRTGSISNTFSYSHSHTHDTLPDPCLTSSHWWCPTPTSWSSSVGTSTKTRTRDPITTTDTAAATTSPNGTTLSFEPTSVCISHNLTTTHFPIPTPFLTTTSTSSTGLGTWNSSTTTARPTNGTATTIIPVSTTTTTTSKPLYINSTSFFGGGSGGAAPTTTTTTLVSDRRASPRLRRYLPQE
ncbi:uncharacterized protein B0I36DRAFT_335715 [Microdochium trichocladiopsis]|uniref:Uncharacterized protein n=1 Tax=Microdochium trichocladiopsis TaxID=1682393 RepID=A0A9P8XWJ5_9PEZI|nr:uncharacterized protein B0I36DRAFT_335715 [Microdochium trichocladiopsis]KAH7018304.1 hypothetical protein B0I36DRAFT_335715 [Microdochium trichocladiopsis]